MVGLGSISYLDPKRTATATFYASTQEGKRFALIAMEVLYVVTEYSATGVQNVAARPGANMVDSEANAKIAEDPEYANIKGTDTGVPYV